MHIRDGLAPVRLMLNAFYFCTTSGHKYAHDVTAFKGHILKREGA
jgi:hypothetical protein